MRQRVSRILLLMLFLAACGGTPPVQPDSPPPAQTAVTVTGKIGQYTIFRFHDQDKAAECWIITTNRIDAPASISCIPDQHQLGGE